MKCKKLLSVALAVCMTFGSAAMLPQNSFIGQTDITASAETTSDYEYSVLKDGTVMITKCLSKDKLVDLVIPTVLDGKKVTGINFGKPGPFAESQNLKSVIFPEGITEVGSMAFASCKKLESVYIPSTVKTVSAYLFAGCSSINSLVLSEGIEKIQDVAFLGCSDLKKVIIPKSVKSIGLLSLGYSGLDVKTSGFKIYCYKNTAGEKYARDNGFDYELINESDYSYHTLADGSAEITKYNGTSKDVLVPPSLGGKKVTSIGFEAFRLNTSITSVNIPYGVTDIGYAAFNECENLDSVYIPNGISNIGGFAFYGTKWLKNKQKQNPMVIENEIVIVGDKCTGKVSIPKGVKCIADYAFEGAKGITDISIPNTVVHVGSYAFSSNMFVQEPSKNFKTITIPKSVKKIGEYAFGYWYGAVGDSKMHKTEGFTIKCYKNTAAEKYAKDNGFKFEILHDYSLDSTKNEVFVTKDSLKDLTLTYHRTEDDNKTFSLFRGVQVDGKTVDKTNYTAESGSLKLTLKKDYLSKLSVGTHKLTVLFEDAYVETDLIVKKTSAATKLRLSGHNRYDTSISIANQFKKLNGNSKFKNVIIASGTGFADALSSAYLAKVKDAPILIVAPGVEDKIVNYVKANTLSTATIYIIGGDVAVPKTVDAKLKQSFKNVKRLWGKNRFGTNLAVLKEAGTGEDHIIIGNGLGYADALSASATGKPILLTSGKGLTTAQKAYLKKAGYKAATLIGESDVVSKGVESDVRKLVKNTDRQGGRTRFETSVLIAKKFFKNPKTVSLAYGLNYPDGLCGAPLSMKYGCPLILASDAVTGPVREYAKNNGVTSAVIYGGSDILSDKAVKTILGK